MIKSIYSQTAKVIAEKPFRLWGISLLNGLLSLIVAILAGPVLGISIVLTYLISTSMTIIFLRGFRGEEVYASQLFACFRDGKTAKRVIGGMAWKDLWIFLWFLIPIAGPIIAIVKSFAYSLTPYILVQEPDVNISKAINVSNERTKGYKGKMFAANILVYIAFIIVSLILSLLAKIPTIGVFFMVINVIITICFAIFAPLFLGLVNAAFYEKIMQNLKNDNSQPQVQPSLQESVVEESEQGNE